MEEIPVGSWAELQEQLSADAWKEQIGRFRSDFAFRARNDVREELPTSLQQLGGDGRSPGLDGLSRRLKRYYLPRG